MKLFWLMLLVACFMGSGIVRDSASALAATQPLAPADDEDEDEDEGSGSRVLLTSTHDALDDEDDSDDDDDGGSGSNHHLTTSH